MITFNNEDIPFVLKHKIKIKNWISTVITSNKRNVGNINYIFCSDDYLYRINVKYLQHYTFTDVISFDYSDKNRIMGDIFISIDRIKDNSEIVNTTFDSELHRVMIHGVLHMMGYKDKTKKELLIMRKMEDKCLTMLK